MITGISVEMSDRTKGKVISVGVHLLLLFLALWPAFQSMDWSEEEPVVIEFSEPVVSLSDETKSSPVRKGSESTTVSDKAASSSPQPQKDQKSAAAAPSLTKERSDITRPDRSEASSSDQTVSETKEAGRDFSDLFGSGGSGGTTNGKTDGDPDVDRLSGLSRGVGTVGRGMQGREVVYTPNIEDDSQKTGRVLVEICVDAAGVVKTAKYTQRGSNTTDSYLVQLAEEAAKKWRFSRSEQPLQCGVITIDFKVE